MPRYDVFLVGKIGLKYEVEADDRYKAEAEAWKLHGETGGFDIPCAICRSKLDNEFHWDEVVVKKVNARE